MSQPVNLSNQAYEKLKFFKVKRKHRSFSTAVEDLLKQYWSPQQSKIQVEEQFNELANWLHSRDLVSDDITDSLQRTKAKTILLIADREKETKVAKLIGDFQ